MSIDNKSNKILYVRKFGHKIRPKKSSDTKSMNLHMVYDILFESSLDKTSPTKSVCPIELET